MEKRAKQIFWNTLLLTAATLCVRTVGVSFQVYVSNRAGAEAMGLFSLLSGVYGFALTLATSGIHLGVTHLIVDAIGKREGARVSPAMRRAFVYALSFGMASSLLLGAFAKEIGTAWLKDARTVSSLRLLALTLPLISLSSAFGGYFTAVRRTYKNAAVQVFEQAIKIGATMYFFAIPVAYDVEKTCCALVLGGTIAEFASFLLTGTLFLWDKRRHFPQKKTVSNRNDGRLLLKTSLPVAFTAYIRSGLITLEHILIPEGLRNSGSTHGAALIAYGSIHSMALPIIFYPAALISSCAGLLVPEFAECRVQHCHKRISYMIARVWWLALVFSIGVAGILICFSEEIGGALYPNTETGKFIRLLAPLIPIMYIDTATDAVMKGLGEQVYSMNINIADALLSVVLVWFLVPRFGINGYLFTIYFSELFNTIFSISHLLSISSPKIRPVKWVFKPLFAIVGATTLVHLLLQKSSLHLQNAVFSIVIHILLVLLVYLLLLFLLGGIEREDAQWFSSLFCKKSRTQCENESADCDTADSQ